MSPHKKELTLVELSAHFDKPLKVAQIALKACPTVIKKSCRRHGIKRWPFRKIRAIRTLLEGNGRKRVPKKLRTFFEDIIQEALSGKGLCRLSRVDPRELGIIERMDSSTETESEDDSDGDHVPETKEDHLIGLNQLALAASRLVEKDQEAQLPLPQECQRLPPLDEFMKICNLPPKFPMPALYKSCVA